MSRSHYHPISILKRLAIAYIVICLLMWAGQRYLMYMPQTNILPPIDYGLNGFEDVHLQSSDGTHIHAWHNNAKTGYPTIIYFHGNGGNLGSRAHYFKLLNDAGFGILALSYRGYGASEGSPSEEGFYNDARAVMEYAITKLMLSPHGIIIYGESIGTGVAVQIATEFPSAALVLQAPYTSITELATNNYPWLPTRWLLKDHFDSLSKISNVNAPILLFHGEKDDIVPAALGKTLFEKANEPKQAIYLPDVGHNDFNLAELTDSLLIFGKEQKIISEE